MPSAGIPLRPSFVRSIHARIARPRPFLARARSGRRTPMRLPRRQFLHLAAGAAALPAVSRFARAQAYPTRPVTVIVPFAPGGATDVAGRIVGEYLSRALGQQFVIENVAGAGGT